MFGKITKIGVNRIMTKFFSFKIKYELKRTLLSYAPSITILAPKSLVDEHKESLKKALEQYE